MVRLHLLLPISLLLSNLGCEPGTSSSAGLNEIHEATDRFQITDLTLQEGEDSQPIWHAHAEKASGTLKSTRVSNIVVTHQAPGKAHTIVLKAPTGIISPLTHDVVLNNALLTDDYHRSVETKELQYLRKDSIIHGTGPVRIVAKSLTINATALIYNIPDGRIELTGPIIGEIRRTSGVLNRD